MMKVVNVVSILALTAAVAGAQAEDEEFLKFQQEQAAALQDYVERTEEEFNAYIEADRKAFAAFKEEVEKVWGDYVGSSR